MKQSHLILLMRILIYPRCGTPTTVVILTANDWVLTVCQLCCRCSRTLSHVSLIITPWGRCHCTNEEIGLMEVKKIIVMNKFPESSFSNIIALHLWCSQVLISKYHQIVYQRIITKIPLSLQFYVACLW